MRLQHVAIAKFRKLDSVAIVGIDPGLTLISGQNEEGKSTVLAALKAAFFDLHTMGGEARELMAPHAGGVPEVAVEFELGGTAYTLRKAFRRGGCELRWAQGRLDGDAAERRLQELLRFTRRAKGPSDITNRGLQAVFWIEQGASFANPAPPGPARDRLAAALQAEVGMVATGDELARLLAAATKACARFWTSHWRETGELAAAAREAQERAEAAGELRQRAQLFEAKVDELERLRADRRRRGSSDELGSARAAAAAKRADVAALARLEAELASTRAKAIAAELHWRALDERASRRAALRTELATTESEIAKRTRATAELEGELATAQAKLRHYAEAEAALAQRFTSVNDARLALLAARERAALRAERAARQGDLQRASAAQARVTALAQHLRDDPATPERLAELQAALMAVAAAAAALAAIATRLVFQPLPGARLSRRGQALDPSQILDLVEPTELELHPFGRLLISPGGGDVAERRRALATADARRQKALAALGATGPASAAKRAADRQLLAADLAAAETELRVLLERAGAANVEGLAARLAVVDQRLAAQLGVVPVPGVAEPSDQASPDDGRLVELEHEQGALTEQKAAAAAAHALAGQRVMEGERELATGTAMLAMQRAGLAAGEVLLAGELESLPDARLASELQAAITAKATLDAAQALLERQVVQADPAGARERLDLALRRIVDIEADAAHLEAQIQRLEGELRGLGADGLGERLAAAEAGLARADVHQATVRREALAWRLLHDELSSTASAARAALVAPLEARLAPLLARLWPTARPRIDAASLAPSHLRRDDEEAFDSLSIGTREQVAVLVRLALARLLLDSEGEAPCLILDDALVYADERRFETMKTILSRAAAELQILVLTCRPRDYFGLAAQHIRLEDCRTT